MARLPENHDDTITAYIASSYDPHTKRNQIQAFTDDKDLMDFYLQTKQRNSLSVRKVKLNGKEWIRLIEEQINDEIHITFKPTRNKNGNKNDLVKMIAIPTTAKEEQHLADLTSSFCQWYINYSYMSRLLFTNKLKRKYHDALGILGLFDVIKFVIKDINSEFTDGIYMDEALLLIRSFNGEYRVQRDGYILYKDD